jgi:hypothetical protein
MQTVWLFAGLGRRQPNELHADCQMVQSTDPQS